MRASRLAESVFTSGGGGGGRRRRPAPRFAAVPIFSSSGHRGSATTRLTVAAAMAEEVAAQQDQQPRGMKVGGIHDAPAGRENDLHTVEVARFAVAEHNSKANAMLEFERVVKVRQQVVGGFMHYLTIEVKESGGAKKLYEAKVWERAWENFKQLQDFKPLDDTTA